MSYDVIIVGGGLAGSAVASTLRRRRNDLKVLVLERETEFKDRVRGENMLPWGVAVAQRLGIVDDLVSAGGVQPRNWCTYVMGQLDAPRDLCATTPHGQCNLNVFHPEMQEALLRRAIADGAEVKRGANVEEIDLAARTVTFALNGERKTEKARVIVGADGRASKMRGWAGFETKRDPDFLNIAGVLVEGGSAPSDAVSLFFGPGLVSILMPLSRNRSRIYAVYPGVAGPRQLSGKEGMPRFLDVVRQSGMPAAWLEGIEVRGPLAEFDGADHWVDHPGKPGVALVGDAAGATDPSWGNGLSLTVTDVENLVECLTATDDWDAAVQRYAGRRDEYYGALHNILSWMTQLFWTPGPEADERRGRVMTRMKQDPSEFPDSVGLGPFGPCGERARKLMLGLET